MSVRRGATVEIATVLTHDRVMANTYSALYCHLVFSTKNREPWLRNEVEARVWAYLGGIARDNGMTAVQIGGMPDHVHLLMGLPASIAVSKAAQFIKGGSSKWIKGEFPDLRGFAWQDGYGAFTVSKSNLPSVIQYIQDQREHHRVKTFQEEYLAFLDRHGVVYDKRYVLD